MPNTYTQISIHAIFAVKGRESFLLKPWRYDVFKYILGIISGHPGAVSLAVGGWKDHVHCFFSLPPTIALSDFMKKIKAGSSKWINDEKFIKGKFQWQESYAAFSYARSQREIVIKYIMNQEEHHKKQTFKEEYLGILEKFEIPFEKQYLIEFYDDVSNDE